MTAPSAAPARRRKRWARHLLVVLALLGLAAAVLIALATDAQRIAAMLLDRADVATGLGWRSTGAASIDWRPLPRLVLRDVEARAADGRRMLHARRVDATVPWSTLRGGDLTVVGITLEGIEVDGDVASAWWSTVPPSAPQPWPRLDRITITDLAWRQGGWRLEGAHLDLRGIAPGGRVKATARGAIRSPVEGPLPEGRAFEADLEATLAGDTARPALHDLALRIGEPTRPGGLEARGALDTADGWRVRLEGRIAPWPQGLPPLPPPLAADAPIAFALDQRGADPWHAETRLRLQTPGAEAAFDGRPDALQAWWSSERDNHLLPPLRATVRADALEVDGMTIEGLDIRSVDDPAPTPDEPPAPTAR